MDGPRAEKEFKRAIELNPNYSPAHEWYGMLLPEQARQWTRRLPNLCARRSSTPLHSFSALTWLGPCTTAAGKKKPKRSRSKRNKDRTRVGMSLDSWSSCLESQVVTDGHLIGEPQQAGKENGSAFASGGAVEREKALLGVKLVYIAVSALDHPDLDFPTAVVQIVHGDGRVFGNCDLSAIQLLSRIYLHILAKVVTIVKIIQKLSEPRSPRKLQSNLVAANHVRNIVVFQRELSERPAHRILRCTRVCNCTISPGKNQPWMVMVRTCACSSGWIGSGGQARRTGIRSRRRAVTER